LIPLVGDGLFLLRLFGLLGLIAEPEMIDEGWHLLEMRIGNC
jgi:hypothetical protein